MPTTPSRSSLGRDSESLKITFAQLLGELVPERAITLLDVSPSWLTEKLMSGPWHADTLRNQVMEALAESHPERFLELNRLGDADWRIARSTAVEALANRDPQTTSAVFEGLAAEDPEHRYVSPRPLMSAWCKQDAQAAREWAAELKNPEVRERVQVALFEAWAETDPRSAWQAFAADQPELVSESNSGPKSSDYFRASRHIISGLASVSVPEAFAAANSIVARLVESGATGTVSARFVGELREELITRLAEGAASSLPEAPGEFVATVDGLIESLRQPGNESGLHLLEKALFEAKRSQWTSEQEFAAANTLVATWNTDRASELLPKIVPLLKSAIDGDASAVETAFFDFPVDVQRALAGPLFEAASEDDENFEFAQKLAALMPPDDVTETTAEIMARHQPEVFAERMAALPPSKATIDAQAEFAWRWAYRDPEAAVTWVETLPETGERRTVASRLSGSWADFDEAAAVAWVSGLPGGPLRDGAALGLASATAEFDPDGALRWAASIIRSANPDRSHRRGGAPPAGIQLGSFPPGPDPGDLHLESAGSRARSRREGRGAAKTSRTRLQGTCAMKTSRTTALALPAVGLMLGVIAGWLAPAGPRPDSGANGATIHRGGSRTEAATNASVRAAAESAEILRRIERRVLETLDTGATAFSGERLRLLCANGPGDEARSYAWRWARGDPAGMFEWFQINEPKFRLPTAGGSSEDFVWEIFTGWARRDADAALGAALAMPNKWRRGVALGSIVRELRFSDPGRAAALAAEHLALLTSSDSSGYLADSRFTIQENLTFIQRLPEGENRAKFLASCLRDSEVSKARDVWNAASENLRRELISGGYVPSKPHDPFAFDATVPESFDSLEPLLRERAGTVGTPEAIAEFLQYCRAAWAKRDLPGAFVWVQLNLRGKLQVEQSAYLFKFAAAADFDAARVFWETLPPSTLRVWAAQELADGAPPERRDAVEAVIKSLPPRDAARIRLPRSGDRADPFAR